MGVNSISFGSPHVRPMWTRSTCGEPNEIKEHTHPKTIAALARDQSKKLDVKETPDRGVYVKDLSTFSAKNSDDMMKIMTKGNENRKVASTAMLVCCRKITPWWWHPLGFVGSATRTMHTWALRLQYPPRHTHTHITHTHTWPLRLRVRVAKQRNRLLPAR